MFATTGFVFSGNNEFDIVAASTDSRRGAYEVFMAFDGRQVSNRADAQFPVRARFAPDQVVPSLRESVDVNSVVNKNNPLCLEYPLRAKSLNHSLRDTDDASCAAQRQPVNPVKREQDVTS